MATFSDGTTTTSYKYNEDGVRTSKTVGSTKTEFFVDGTTILAQKTGNDTTAFYYDANGKRIAFKYDDNMYYYVYNLQGDVTHIINAYGDIVGTYEYDAWGQIANLSSLTAIAQVNPFRYRGYYYDNESGLYYLNSRYYNPEWGRFINADGYVTTGQGLTSYNMFVYCCDNPVNNFDPTGAFSMAALMTTLNGMVHLASGTASYIETQNNNIKNSENVDNLKTIYDSISTSWVDANLNSTLKYIQPVSSLNSTSNPITYILGIVSENIGLYSVLTIGMNIIWDYETYGISDDFFNSTTITLAFAGLGILAGGIVACMELPLLGTFVVGTAFSIGLGCLENLVRKECLGN